MLFAQRSLSNYISLFTEYLPKVECGVRQARMLWEEVADWDESIGTSAIIHHEAKFRALLHEDQMVYEHALYMIAVFNEKLEQAQIIFLKNQTTSQVGCIACTKRG